VRARRGGCAGAVRALTLRVLAQALERIVLPVAREFAPDLVLVSAGFDGAAGDPLGGFLISPAMFGRMTAMMRNIAAESADGRLVLALEGGYNPEARSSPGLRAGQDAGS
jgi:acetoin utilization deacetylase AcuC-like enzyme